MSVLLRCYGLFSYKVTASGMALASWVIIFHPKSAAIHVWPFNCKTNSNTLAGVAHDGFCELSNTRESSLEAEVNSVSDFYIPEKTFLQNSQVPNGEVGLAGQGIKMSGEIILIQEQMKRNKKCKFPLT